MNLNSYQALALRTAPPAISHNDPNDLDHAITGIHTEGGELADIRKRAEFYDDSNGVVDRVHVMEEVGDLLWYCALAMRYVGRPMADAAVANLAKLQKRYPHKFENVRVLNRDLSSEREALETTAQVVLTSDEELADALAVRLATDEDRRRATKLARLLGGNGLPETQQIELVAQLVALWSYQDRSSNH